MNNDIFNKKFDRTNFLTCKNDIAGALLLTSFNTIFKVYKIGKNKHKPRKMKFPHKVN